MKKMMLSMMIVLALNGCADVSSAVRSTLMVETSQRLEQFGNKVVSSLTLNKGNSITLAECRSSTGKKLSWLNNLLGRDPNKEFRYPNEQGRTGFVGIKIRDAGQDALGNDKVCEFQVDIPTKTIVNYSVH